MNACIADSVCSGNTSARFGLAFLGHMVVAISTPVINTCPTLFAELWFGENERALANSSACIWH